MNVDQSIEMVRRAYLADPENEVLCKNYERTLIRNGRGTITLLLRQPFKQGMRVLLDFGSEVTIGTTHDCKVIITPDNAEKILLPGRETRILIKASIHGVSVQDELDSGLVKTERKIIDSITMVNHGSRIEAPYLSLYYVQSNWDELKLLSHFKSI